MKKYLTVFFALNIFAFCLSVSGYASALDDMKKAQASSKAAEQASENINDNVEASQYAAEQARFQSSQNFDTRNTETSAVNITPNTTGATGTITPHNSSPKLKVQSKPVPVPTGNTQTTKQVVQTKQNTQQNTAVKQTTQKTSPAVQNTTAQTKTATTQNNTLKAPPKAKLSVKQREDTTALVRSNQLKEDMEYDQMTLKEYIDPFTGEPVVKG